MIRACTQGLLAVARKPLDLAVYQHALATALIDVDETKEAERLLATVTESLRSPQFAELREEAARREAFEVYTTARRERLVASAEP